tara:strand:- start:3812 stop:4237 length:426 start_codon:yes stop_codon:yes gene_type:complete
MKSIYLKPDINGIVNEKFLTVAISNQVRKTKLNSFVPANGNIHKVYSGKSEEYALYFISIMKKSSKLNANFRKVVQSYPSTGILKEIERIGLFSVNPVTCPEIDSQDLFLPEVNIAEGVRLYEELILREGKLPEVNGVIFI